MESMTPGYGEQGDPASVQSQDVSAETLIQVDAIIKEILLSMTPEQVKAIFDMQITREVARTLMTEKGINMGGPGSGREMSGADGQPPIGTPPIGDQNGSGFARSGNAANGQQPGFGLISSEVISALIEVLQSK